MDGIVHKERVEREAKRLRAEPRRMASIYRHVEEAELEGEAGSCQERWRNIRRGCWCAKWD